MPNKASAQPPKSADRFLKWFLAPHWLETIQGDLHEGFQYNVKRIGLQKARWLYWWEVLGFVKPRFIKTEVSSYSSNPSFSHSMIRNYFKIAFRNLLGSKMYTSINVLGLAIGITTCTLISLYVFDEMRYDTHHSEGDRIYRVASEAKGEKWAGLAAPVAGGLKNDFPEIEQVSRLLRMPGIDKFLLQNEENQKQFYETNGFYIDSTFFRVFSYDFKFGDKATALYQPNSIVISEEMAQKLFGDANPVNKIIKVGLPFGGGEYTVKGVMQSNNYRSHIPAGFFLSMNNSDVGQWVKSQTNWTNNSVFHTYVKLNGATDAAGFEAKLAEFYKRHGGKDMAAANVSKSLFIQPLQRIYLHSNIGFEIAPNGNITYLYVFGSIAAFLLVIACINFMNLSTARSERRAKEVGVRKAIGAQKSTLVGQFLGESVLLSAFALLVSLFLIQLLVPVFNQLTGKNLSLSQDPEIFGWLAVLALVTGLISGMYPAFYLASFVPVATLKGQVRNSVSAVLVRKGLVVFQFTISVILILAAILTDRQMEYLSSRNLGFSKNQKLILPLQSRESFSNYSVLKNELGNNSQIISSAKGSTYPGIENVMGMLFYAEGKPDDENVEISTTYVDNDYVKTLGITLLQGRSFSNEFTSDTASLVLNEVAIHKLGYTANNAIGKKIHYNLDGKRHTMNIIGVVKNYHFNGLQKEIKPLALSIAPLFSGVNNYMVLDVKSSSYEKLLSGVEAVWKRINPNSPFEYSFLDKDFEKNYQKEAQTSQLIRYFSLIGIVIACLGLFGLATFTAEQRTKEIGIRKVLGASVLSITKLLSFDFLKLVFIAFVIATPIAWWAMEKWLSEFAYKTELSWGIFAIAGVLAAFVALLTISFQSVKAALLDPVKSLKSE